MSERRAAGDAAERLAERHLARHGLRLVARNWHCRFGELDLIMADGEALVFVEVRRRRRSKRFASAAESVGPAKRAKLVRSARAYLAGRRRQPPCRFDVVGVQEDASGTLELQWIRDAFSAEG